jgi:hypothetical protein
MARDAYKSEKRRKELERQKKQAEKREKRLKKNEERSEAEVLADLFGVPYQSATGEGAEAGGAEPSSASSPTGPDVKEPGGEAQPPAGGEPPEADRQ